MNLSVSGPNSPFVVWATCFLWLTSLFAIAWSLVLFFFVGDILLLTGTDLVNAFVLLSGVIMLPTNMNMLCSIANGLKIDHKTKIFCCPLWLSILWIIAINTVAATVCLMKIVSCRDLIQINLSHGMKYYRNDIKYKHILDNLQWSLKCCGLNSYNDWFTKDWYDKIRDYEWDPLSEKKRKILKKSMEVADSVPLSCCKSGSCISNYLTELGTYSINTSGCAPILFRLVIVSLNAHLAMFVTIVIIEMITLKLLMQQKNTEEPICTDQHKNSDLYQNADIYNNADQYSNADQYDNANKHNELKKIFPRDEIHIASVKEKFEASSESCLLNPEDTEEEGSRNHNTMHE